MTGEKYKLLEGVHQRVGLALHMDTREREYIIIKEGEYCAMAVVRAHDHVTTGGICVKCLSKRA